MGVWRRKWLVVVLGAVILAGPLLDDALARRPRDPGGYKQWTSGGMEVAVEEYDGSRIVGTFRGTIQPTASNPGDPPASVEGGSFSVILTDTGV